MDKQQVHFVTSAVLASQYPRPLNHEIVFVGRSNVGKSSLLNALFFNQQLAKVSSTPGKTRLINFFQWERVSFVDLPGYGYAKGPKKEQGTWQAMMDAYFHSKRPLRLAFLLTDARHDPSPLDLEMAHYLHTVSLPYCIVLTKWDTLTQSERVAKLRDYAHRPNPSVPVVPASSKTRLGMKDLWKVIHDYCAPH